MEMAFLPPLGPDYTMREVEDLLQAYALIHRSNLTEDEVERMWVEKNDFLQYLKAEKIWKAQVEKWLHEEQRQINRRTLIEGIRDGNSAARGWYRLKELLPNLDGVDDYADLSPARRAQYEMFAQGVLNES